MSRKFYSRGFIFSTDAFLAAILLVSGMILILSMNFHTTDTKTIFYYSDDVITVLSTITIAEINNSEIEQWTAQGYITDYNNTVLYQIGELWARGNVEVAENLTRLVIDTYIPPRFGVTLYAGGNHIFNKSAQNESQGKIKQRAVSVSKRSITGIEKAKPISGSSSSAYLRKITDKRNKKYISFGGFVGQGNITFFGLELPTDANIETTMMELDTPGSFELYINGVYCMDIIGTNGPTEVDIFNLTPCQGDILLNQNNTIYFESNSLLNESYIAGGFIRVAYTTDELLENLPYGNLRYNFPGVYGIANLYDGFHVPGNLTNMSIYLRFLSNYTTYLTIGGRVVYSFDGSEVEQAVTITHENLTQFPILLDYDALSNGTIPIRFASYDQVLQTVLGDNADVILITDLSGSMKLRMNSWSNPGNAIPTCKDSDMSNPNSRRLGIAGCLDDVFNDIILNESRPVGNRLWLVDYSTDAFPFYSNNLNDLTHENVADEIDTRYKSKSQHEIKGGTCICCALNMAYDILNTYSDDTRVKSVVLLTDGVAGYTCGRYWDGSDWRGTNGTSYERQENIDECTGDEADCLGNQCDRPIDNAIWSAQRIYDDLNATIYGIGIGPLTTCENANDTLSAIAEAGNGSFLLSDDGMALKDFYRQIANEILARIHQVDQVVSVEGSINASILYEDSYIDIIYDPAIEPFEQNEISVTLETDKFDSCSHVLNIPNGIRISDAYVTSYSAENWTQYVIVDGNIIYNLSTFSTDYVSLGDPFQIHIPSTYLTSGSAHTITIGVADNDFNLSPTCSLNNSIVYTALFSSSIGRSQVVEHAQGCTWTVEYEDGSFGSFSIPQSYGGPRTCSYQSTNYTLIHGAYSPDDAYDVSIYELFHKLDFDGDGRIFINVDVNDLEIIVNSISSIPYLWGPSVMEVQVWQ